MTDGEHPGRYSPNLEWHSTPPRVFQGGWGREEAPSNLAPPGAYVMDWNGVWQHYPDVVSIREEGNVLRLSYPDDREKQTTEWLAVYFSRHGEDWVE